MLDGEKWICSSHAINNNKLVFYANGVWCEVDLDNFETSYVCDVKNIEYVQKRGASCLVSINNALFIISWSPLSIARYDFELSEIKQVYDRENGVASFINIEQWNNHIYLFRRTVDEIIVLEESGAYNTYPFLPNVDKQNMRGCMFNDEMYFFSQAGRTYYKYDFKNNTIMSKELPFSIENLQDVKYYEQQIYILGDKYLKIWDGGEKIRHIDLVNEKLDVSIRGMMIPLKDKVYVLPRTEDDIFSIGYDGAVSKYIDYPKDFHYTQSDEWLKIGSKYFSYVRKGGIYYFPRRATNYMLTIDIAEQVIRWVQISEPCGAEEMKLKLSENRILDEEIGYLKSYIGYIKNIKSKTDEVP